MVIMPNRVSPNFHNPKPIPMHHSSAHKTSITQPNHPALMHSDEELVPTPLQIFNANVSQPNVVTSSQDFEKVAAKNSSTRWILTITKANTGFASPQTEASSFISNSFP